MIIKYVGSKWYIADWIINHFPKHDVFVDVFGGSGAIILKKPKSKIEVYNDIDEDLVNLFEIIRKRKNEFIENLKFLLYSRKLRKEWEENWKKGIKPEDPLERAIQYYFLLNTSISGKIFGGFSISKERNKPMTIYLYRFEKIEFFAERFHNVVIENLDYKEIFEKYDSKKTLFYCDPPYFIKKAKEYYTKEEWNLEKHKDFALRCNNLKGFVIISYYWFPQIKEWYLDKGWFIDKKVVVKHSQKVEIGKNKEKAEEILLMNYNWKEVPKFIEGNKFQKTLFNETNFPV